VCSSDLDLDFAVVNRGDDTVTVLYGDGAGGFSGAETYGVGLDPWAVAAADFDGDTWVDLAVANYEDDSISILPGGASGFGSAVEHVLGGATPAALAADDLNGDNRPDLVVVDSSNDRVAVLIGNGDGSFAATVHYAVGEYPISLVTGEFDGVDGPDIAVVCYTPDVVSILLNDGDGTFGAAASYDVGLNPVGITTDDFDGDTHLDLAVANNEGDSASILLGAGDGTFGAAVEAAMVTGAHPAAVVAGLFNHGDTDVDLAVANHSTKSVTILQGDGSGSFSSIGDFSVGQWPSALGTGDFDSDTWSDVVVANYGTATVSVMRSDGRDAVVIQLHAGWNLVSVPVTLDDMSVEEVFPAEAVVYWWDPEDSTYEEPAFVDTDRAYWVAVAQDEILDLRGVGVSPLESALLAGWNMVGSSYGGVVPVGELEDDPDGSIETNAIYWWDAANGRYTLATAIEPGVGYWAIVSAEGSTLTIGS
jgi:hypothetical protein